MLPSVGELWVKRYNGLADRDDYAASREVGADGSELFVTGSNEGSATGWNCATVAYDASTGVPLLPDR